MIDVVEVVGGGYVVVAYGSGVETFAGMGPLPVYAHQLIIVVYDGAFDGKQYRVVDWGVAEGGSNDVVSVVGDGGVWVVGNRYAGAPEVVLGETWRYDSVGMSDVLAMRLNGALDVVASVMIGHGDDEVATAAAGTGGGVVIGMSVTSTSSVDCGV